MQKVKPAQVRLETSSFCQLKCPACPTTSLAINPVINKGFLKFNDFKQFIDKNNSVNHIELSNYGEIFLNPELSKIIEYAYHKKIKLVANNGVNLNHVKEAVLENLVKYNFHSMTCSIDGANNESYQKYRIKGNFDKVIANIKKINEYKSKYQSEFPYLTWQFIVFGYNENEIELAQKMAADLNMRFALKLSWNPDFSPLNNQDKIRKLVGAASREEYKLTTGNDYMHMLCHQLWDNPQINWDGKLLGCCRNFWGDFGKNVFTEGLIKSLNGSKMKYARLMLLGKKPPRTDIPCTTCNIYLHMQLNKRWLVRPIKISIFKKIFSKLFNKLTRQ